MNEISERIIRFIGDNRVMTLATSENNAPYCCSIFYVFDPEECNFYFMSSVETKHIHQASWQPLVAGTIVPGNTSIAKIQGIQFTGIFFQPEDIEREKAKKMYLRKFPMARLIDSEIWMIEVETIKMTDNTLGFGKKILWNRILRAVEA